MRNKTYLIICGILVVLLLMYALKLDGLEKQIVQYEQQIAAANQEIAALREQIAGLNGNMEELASDNMLLYE